MSELRETSDLGDDELPREVSLAVSMVGGVLVAVDAERVSGVIENEDLSDDERAHAVDVYRLFRDDGGPPEDRRALRLELADDAFLDVLVGPDVIVSEVESDRLHPVPAFLGGARDLIGLIGFAEVESVALILDPSVLAGKAPPRE